MMHEKIRKELFRYFLAAFSFGVNWAADKYIAFGEITRKHFMSIKNLSLSFGNSFVNGKFLQKKGLRLKHFFVIL